MSARLIMAAAAACGAACGARTELGGDPPGSVDAATDAPAEAEAARDAAADMEIDVVPASGCAFAKPTFLVDTHDEEVYEVAVDAAYVYYTAMTPNHVWRVPKVGGTPVILGQPDTGGFAHDLNPFALDATFAYSESEAFGDLVRIPKGGGAEVGLGFAVPNAAVVLDGNNLYTWSFYGGYYGTSTTLYRVPLGGGSGSLVTNSLPQYMNSVLIDGSVAYLGGPKGLFTLDLGSGVVTPIPNITTANHIVMDAKNVYATTNPNGTTNFILSVPKNGGPPKTLLQAGYAFNLALDVQWLYFGDQSDGSVRRVMTDGSSPTLVGQFSGDWPTGIAVDEHCAYWGSLSGVVVAPK